jgi:hypothetical protein
VIRPVARIWLIFCAALPVQRWVLGASALLIVAGLLTMPVAPRGVGAVLILLGIGIAPVAMIFALGPLFRALSVPVQHRFLPRFRERMLIALLTLLTAPVLVTVLFITATGMPVALAQIIVYPLAILSAMVWVVLFAPASLWGGIALVVAAMALPRLPEPALANIESLLAPLPVGLMLVAAWLVFARWYLHVPRIGPFAVPSPFRGLAAFDRRMAEENDRVPVSQAAATTMHLMWRTRPTGIQLLVLIATFVLIVAVLGATRLHDRLAMVVVAILFAEAGAYRLGFEVASRARTLWLRAAYSRIELFRTAEIELWMTVLAFVFVPLIVVLAALLYVTHLPGSVILALWSCAAGTAVLAIYLGLIHTRGFQPFDVVAGTLGILSIAAVAWQVLTGSFDTRLLYPVAGGQFALAGICRAIGRHRWDSVDFSGLRPARIRRTAFTDLLAGRVG